MITTNVFNTQQGTACLLTDARATEYLKLTDIQCSRFNDTFKSLFAKGHYDSTVDNEAETVFTWLKGNSLLSLMLGNLVSLSPTLAYREETLDFWGLVCLELKLKSFVLQYKNKKLITQERI